MRRLSDVWQGSVVFFGAADLEEVHGFYHGCLELPLYKDQGLCRIYEVPGGGLLGFCSHLAVHHAEKSPIITLLTDDVDGMYERLQEHGYTPETKPKHYTKFNIYHFFLKDPNGYTVEIQTFLD